MNIKVDGVDFSVSLRGDDPIEFDRAISTSTFSWDPDKTAWNEFFCRKYYPLTGGGHPYAAISVAAKGSVVALVECNPEGAFLTQFGEPITIRKATDASDELFLRAVEVSVHCLEQIAQQVKTKTILIAGPKLDADEGDPEMNPESPVNRACQKRKAGIMISTEGFVDLSLGESGIHKKLRKSYRSLINWGRKNIRMEYYNADNPNRKLLDEYQSLRERGRWVSVTDPVLSFFQDTIESGNGELAVGYLDGTTPMASTLTIWAGKSTRYVAGNYPDKSKEQPLSHWPLYDAIIRSLERGDRYFSMGKLHLHDSQFQGSEPRRRKMQSIGFFKKGFCTNLANQIYWTVQVPN